MVANQSKHTVRFSDLTWQKDVPQFPLAWQVGEYLQRYMDRYLTNHDGFKLRTSHKVTAARQVEEIWEVDVTSDGNTDTERFDKIIIATGFFGKPLMPACLSGNDHKVPVIHSSRYRDLQGLLGQGRQGGGKILIVGGQMSGVEIAGTIGVHLSSAINSPEPFAVPDIDRYTIHHIVQRPIWVFPLFNTPEVCWRMILCRIVLTVL
jgi:cation diffusion facilitator CzcD-associated flavoprotein CzcO